MHSQEHRPTSHLWYVLVGVSNAIQANAIEPTPEHENGLPCVRNKVFLPQGYGGENQLSSGEVDGGGDAGNP